MKKTDTRSLGDGGVERKWRVFPLERGKTKPVERTPCLRRATKFGEYCEQNLKNPLIAIARVYEKVNEGVFWDT